MSKLKYINGKIDFYKEKLADIKNCKKACVREDQLEELLKEETFYTERLQTLKQIKNDLEAWEVVKDKSVDIHDIIHCSSLEVFNCGLYKDYQLTEEEYQKIKKALELKNV